MKTTTKRMDSRMMSARPHHRKNTTIKSNTQKAGHKENQSWLSPQLTIGATIIVVCILLAALSH